jgi:septum formation protein
MKKMTDGLARQGRQVILASISSRRKQLMKLLKIKFKAVDSKYKEVLRHDLSHSELVKFLALGKARAAAKKYPRAIIIAADTIVSFRGQAIGKPKNQTEAFTMLSSFSGKSNLVVTGTVILDALSKQTIIFSAKNKIYFKKLSSAEIKKYIASGEPFDKAGGYNLQGLGFNLIKKMEGDFTTALGLPMAGVFNALKALGVKIKAS